MKKTLFTILTIVLSCSLTYASGFMILTPSEYAAYQFGKQVGTAANALAEHKRLQQNISQQIRQTRKSFWRCNFSCNDYKNVRHKFAQLLYEKDIHFLTDSSYVQNGTALLNSLSNTQDIDGGIRHSCSNQFITWQDAVTSKYPVEQFKKDSYKAMSSMLQGRVANSIGNNKLQDAIDASTDEYKKYVLCRDDWEYSARPIIDKPKDPQDFISSLIKVNLHLTTRNEAKEILQKQYYPKYGKVTVGKVAQKLFKAEKTKRSWQALEDPKSLGCNSKNAYYCFKKLLVDSSVSQKNTFESLNLKPIKNRPDDFNNTKEVASSMMQIEKSCQRLPPEQPGRDECIQLCQRNRARVETVDTFNRKMDWKICMRYQNIAYGVTVSENPLF